jgi:sugar phosphate isomerase/epimerase
MIYAAASWNLHNGSRVPDGLVAEAVAAGFTGISFDPGRQDLKHRWLRKAVDEHELPVTIHGNDLVTPETVTALYEQFGERIVNVTMNVVIRHDSRGIPIDGGLLCDNLVGILEATAGARFTVGIEDFPRDRLAMGFFAQDLAPLLGLPRFGILIDLGHMHFWLHARPYYSGVSPEQFLANVPVPITEVHVHDNDGTADQHRPLGTGTNDIDAAVRGLRAAGFDGVCTVEVHVPSGADRLADAMAVYAANLRTVRAAMERDALEQSS